MKIFGVIYHTIIRRLLYYRDVYHKYYISFKLIPLGYV